MNLITSRTPRRRVALAVLAFSVVGGASFGLALPANAAVLPPLQHNASSRFDSALSGYSIFAGAALTAPASRIRGNVAVGAAITVDAGTRIGDGALGATPAMTDVGAVQDMVVGAYGNLSTPTPDSFDLTGLEDLGGATLTAGVYHSAAALAVTGPLTFDGGGESNAVFIIQTDAAINTTAGTEMNLINGARAANIYWVSGAATTLGASSEFSGNIVSYAAVTVGASSTVHGKVISVTAAVTLDADKIYGTTSKKHSGQ